MRAEINYSNFFDTEAPRIPTISKVPKFRQFFGQVPINSEKRVRNLYKSLLSYEGSQMTQFLTRTLKFLEILYLGSFSKIGLLKAQKDLFQKRLTFIVLKRLLPLQITLTWKKSLLNRKTLFFNLYSINFFQNFVLSPPKRPILTLKPTCFLLQEMGKKVSEEPLCRNSWSTPVKLQGYNDLILL